MTREHELGEHGVSGALDSSESRHSFTDPVTGRECVLVVRPVERLFDALLVEHDDCDTLAEVSADLDCFFCRDCHWNGRISGAWAVDMWEKAQ